MAHKWGDQVTFMLVVGQNAWQGPATVTDAANYKAQHGYDDAWVVVSDPDWQKMQSGIKDKTNTLPNMAVLDGQMKLLHTTTNNTWISHADQAISQAVNQ